MQALDPEETDTTGRHVLHQRIYDPDDRLAIERQVRRKLRPKKVVLPKKSPSKPTTS